MKELTAEQLKLLNLVNRHRGKLTPEDASHELRINYTTAYGRLKTLERKGLIEGFLGADLSGGRDFKVYDLTDAGELIIRGGVSLSLS